MACLLAQLVPFGSNLLVRPERLKMHSALVVAGRLSLLQSVCTAVTPYGNGEAAPVNESTPSSPIGMDVAPGAYSSTHPALSLHRLVGGENNPLGIFGQETASL
jgi:hypothetical protein